MHKTFLTRATLLLLESLTLAALLVGCATNPLPTCFDCPQPKPIPAALTESASPNAQAYSKKVRAYLLKVQGWLKGPP